MEIKTNDIWSCYKNTAENNAIAIFDLAEMFRPTIIFLGNKKYLYE